MKLFPHQQLAFDDLLSRAKTYFSADWHDLSIRPRFHSLICGPTGTGKTAVAMQLASSLDANLYRVSINNWMPLGASNRGSRETVVDIARHIASSDKSVIFIDELDKIWHESSWKSYIKAELFDLLDGRWSDGLKVESDEDEPTSTCAFATNREKAVATRKLRYRTFIAAAGTFQDFYELRTVSKIGFGESENPQREFLDPSEIAKRLPRELTNRFHSHLIALPPLKRADYHDLAETALANLPIWLHATFRIAAARQLETAVAAQKGCRYVEECLLEALQNAKKPQEVTCEDKGDGPCAS